MVQHDIGMYGLSRMSQRAAHDQYLRCQLALCQDLASSSSRAERLIASFCGVAMKPQEGEAVAKTKDILSNRPYLPGQPMGGVVRGTCRRISSNILMIDGMGPLFSHDIGRAG